MMAQKPFQGWRKLLCPSGGKSKTRYRAGLNSNPAARDCAEIMSSGCIAWHLSFFLVLLKASQVLGGWEFISSSTVGVTLCGWLSNFP